MRTAIILTGFVRTYKTTFDFLDYYLLSKYPNTDLYLMTWDHTQNNPKITNLDTYDKIDQNDILETYNKQRVISYAFEDYLGFIQTKEKLSLISDNKQYKYGDFWVDRLKDQWRIVQKGWNLIKNPEQYDIIGRIRYDIMFLATPVLKEKELCIPPAPTNMFDIIKYSDHMAFGDPAQMQKYCNLYSSISDMSDKVDISDADKMLKYYLENHNDPIVPIINKTLKYTIMR
jgi:hypothetical protein